MFINNKKHYLPVRKAEPYFLLHTPANLDLEMILSKEKKTNLLHSYAYLCHAILRGYLLNIKLDATEDHLVGLKYVPLDSRILRRMLTRRKATEIIEDMIAWKVIERRDSYRVTTAATPGTCKGYRFTSKYRNQDIKWIALHNRPLWKRLESQRDEQRVNQLLHVSSSQTMLFLHRQLLKVKLDLPSACDQVLKTAGGLSVTAGNSFFVSLISLPAGSSPDQSLHITHSLPFLTSLYTISPSPHPLPPHTPSYVVSFSNFMRLGRLLKFYLASIGEIPWEFKKDPKTGRLFSNLTNLSRSFRKHLYLESHEKLVVVDVGECQPFMFSALLLERAKEIWGKRLPEDVSHYMQLAANRQFYRFIMDKCDVAPTERDAFKKIIFGSIFYCGRRMAERPENLPGRTFINHFPNVYQILCEWKVQSDRKNELALRLMKLESKIMLDNVCARIAGYGDPNFFIATIHDGIVTTESRAAQVKQLIENAFWQEMGRVPTVKIEPFNFRSEPLPSVRLSI